MNHFFFYQMGVEHILDIGAYDHMLFVVTLCSVFQIRQWKQVLILLTAFTVGHSITLVLAGLDKIQVNAALIETLIPITILLTALYNLVSGKSKATFWNYLLALGFGLIHGMGFSNFFRVMMEGLTDSVVLPLFLFNVGIELGQIQIVLIFFLTYLTLNELFRIRHISWSRIINVLSILISILLIINLWKG